LVFFTIRVRQLVYDWYIWRSPCDWWLTWCMCSCLTPRVWFWQWFLLPLSRKSQRSRTVLRWAADIPILAVASALLPITCDCRTRVAFFVSTTGEKAWPCTINSASHIRNRNTKGVEDYLMIISRSSSLMWSSCSPFCNIIGIRRLRSI